MSTDLKVSKGHIFIIIQSGGFLGSLLSKLAVPLMKIVVPLAKTVLAPLGTTAAALAINTGIKKTYGYGHTTLIISNKEMNDIMKIIQALENSNIVLKGVTKTIKNETKEQRGGFLSMLLGILGTRLSWNLLTGNRILRAGSGNKKGKGIVRAGSGNKKGKGIVLEKSWYWKRMGFLMPPYPLTNFEIRKYYKNKPRFNGVFSRNNLPQKNKGWGLYNKSWWICMNFLKKMKLFISIALVLNIFLKKLKNLWEMKK